MRKGQGSEKVFKARSRNFELDPISRGNLLKAFVGRKGPSWEGPRGHLTQPPCYRWEVWGGRGARCKVIHVFRTRASPVLSTQEVILFHAEEDLSCHSSPGVSVPSGAGRGQSPPPSFPPGGGLCFWNPVSRLGSPAWGWGVGAVGRGAIIRGPRCKMNACEIYPCHH